MLVSATLGRNYCDKRGRTTVANQLTRRLAKLGYIDALLSPTGEGTATA